MRFVLAVNGSRGDIQPAVALGAELGDRGHQVTMAVPSDLVDFSRGAGLATEEYGGSTHDLLESELVRSDMRSLNPRIRLRAIGEITVRGGRAMQQRLAAIATTASADAIIAGSVGQERAHNVCQSLDITHIPLHYCPLRRNRSTSLLSHFGIDAPEIVNDLSWRLAEQALWLATRTAENTLRAELDLPPSRTPYATQIEATGVPEIQAYDPALFPSLPTEWGSRRPLLGFLNLAPAQRSGVGDPGIDGDLDEWLSSGPPPVYVGFGSMPPTNPQALAAAFDEVARAHGVRLLVAGGWSGFMADADAVDPGRLRTVGRIDHDRILPRCRAAVHHGGAGSVAAGLRAGLPTLVTWVGADQPLWGQALSANHVGTSLPMSRVNSTRLKQVFEVILHPDTQRAAQQMAQRLISPQAAVAGAANLVEASTRGTHLDPA